MKEHPDTDPLTELQRLGQEFDAAAMTTPVAALAKIANSSANPDDPAYLTASAMRIIARDALAALRASEPQP